jgi:hypothetical protein
MHYQKGAGPKRPVNFMYQLNSIFFGARAARLTA